MTKGENVVVKYNGKEIGVRLVQIREKNKMTQKQLAEYLNVSIRTVGRYEHGEIMLGIDTIILLCKLFCVSADYFLFGIPNPLDLPEENMEEKIMDLQAKMSEETKQKVYQIMQILL